MSRKGPTQGLRVGLSSRSKEDSCTVDPRQDNMRSSSAGANAIPAAANLEDRAKVGVMNLKDAGTFHPRYAVLAKIYTMEASHTSIH